MSFSAQPLPRGINPQPAGISPANNNAYKTLVALDSAKTLADMKTAYRDKNFGEVERLGQNAIAGKTYNKDIFCFCMSMLTQEIIRLICPNYLMI
ncbi:MAG: hypothetical protein LBQ83_03890 [Candidatus Margulisbacteria bacterium]|jgi:hypothetical protein|nr:hypothetical protein [Candidatus Margulisiibacteriota bacterium]